MANTGPTTEEAPVSQEAESRAETTCVHHWIIESPSGRTSTGVCRICGARRDFQNYVSDFIWEGDSTEAYHGGWRKPVTELIRPGDVDTDEESSFAGREAPELLF